MTTYPVKLLKDKDGTAFIPVVNSDSIITPEGDTLDDLLDEKQDTLISGTNLKTINNQSLLGEGNITIQSGGSATDVQINGTSITSSGVANLQTEGTYSSSNKIATKNYCVPRAVNVTSAQKELSTVILNNGTSAIISSVNNTDQIGAMLNMSPGNITFAGGESGTDIQLHGVATPTSSTDAANKKYVDDAITALPEPMIFKGSLGTGGTITSLPTASSANEGFTYKVITAGTYASQTAKIGDTFISDGNTWILIPSGDEPSGTVTSITLNATSPIAIDSSSAITTSGTRTLSHANSGVTAGTYKSVTVNATGHVTEGTNPTTISGYGITDAKIASGTITLGSNTITPLTANSTLDATKLSGTIPSSCYTDTNNAVTQTATTTSNAYELLFSSTADNTTRTEGARKTSTLTYNPSTKALSTGGTVNGYTLAAACAKAVVTSVDTSASLPTSNAVKTFVEGKGYTTNTGTITKVQANGTDVASSGTANIPAASTSAYGVTKLSDATNSTSTALAATANAVKTAYDLADEKLEKNYTQTQANGEIKWQGGADSTNSELISKVTSNTNNNFSQAEITSDNILLTSGIDGVNARSTVNMTPYAINIANQTTDGSINLSADLITLNGGTKITTTPDTNYSIVNKKYVDDAVGILRDNNAAATVDSNAGNLYRYQICLTNRDGHLIPYNNISNATTTYTKGLSSQPFDPFAPIYYYNSTTTVNAGSNAGAGSLYQHIYFDCRYSMNINSGGTSGTTALTPNAPVYLVALYNETTGLATLQGVSTSNNYLDRSSIVQAFPSVEIQSEIANNFYIFIYLGRAGSKYQIELDVNHPVYKWDSTNETYTIFFGGGGSVGPASQITLGTLRAWADTNTNTLYLSNQEYTSDNIGR